MYSYEVRMRAVALYIKLGKRPKAAIEHYPTHCRCVSATMRALSYPGRATLTAWVRGRFPKLAKLFLEELDVHDTLMR